MKQHNNSINFLFYLLNKRKVLLCLFYDKEYECTSVYQDFISNIRTVKALNNDKYFEKIIQKKGAEYYKKQSKYIKCYLLEEIIRNILIIMI